MYVQSDEQPSLGQPSDVHERAKERMRAKQAKHSKKKKDKVVYLYKIASALPAYKIMNCNSLMSQQKNSRSVYVCFVCNQIWNCWVHLTSINTITSCL